MFVKPLNVGVTLIAAVAVLSLASCSSKPAASPAVPFSSAELLSDKSGFGGLRVTSSTTTNATVVSFDATALKMELKMPDGTVSTYPVEPEAVRQSQLKPGDTVTVMTAEERAAFLDQSTMPPPDGLASGTIRMPQDSWALARKVSNQSYTAKIMAIDLWQRLVTLQLADGQTNVIKVREAMNLANVKVGDTVSVRISQATLILPGKL